jgi:tyrosine-protein kinase Etk/Wzc
MAQAEKGSDSSRAVVSHASRHELLGSPGQGNLAQVAGVSHGVDAGLLTTLRRKYRVVLGAGAFTFALVMGATLLSNMEFGSSARLYLGELDGKARSSGNAEDLDLALSGQSDLASEIEIMRSRSLVSRAVLEAGLNVGIVPLGSEPPAYWRWRLAGRDPNLLDVARKEVRAHRARLTGDAQKPERVEVHFTSDLEYDVWSPAAPRIGRTRGSRRIGSGTLNQPFAANGLELTLQSGSERAPARGVRYELVIEPLEEVVDAALKVLEVTAPKSSGKGDPVKVVALRFKQSSPALASTFLEELMRCYLQERQAWKTADATAAEAFVTQQLGTTRSLLDDIQRKLADYRTQNRAVILDNEAKAMIAQIGKYEEQRVASRLELAALSDVERSLSEQNVPAEAYMFGEAKDSVLESLATSLSQARRELTDLEARYNASAPGVREQRAQVQGQLSAIRSYVRGRRGRAESNLSTLDEIIQQYENKLRSVPEAELGLAQLTRESQVYGALYSNLLMRQQQTAIVKASTVSRNRILDPARVAYREESPRLLLRLSSGILGLFLGALLVVSRHLLKGTFSSEGDVRRSLSQWPILGSLPKRVSRASRRRSRQGDALFDLLSGDVNFEFVEAFRSLRTRLYQSTPGSGGKVFLVTSPSRGDGKTTCVSSLASILVADGKSVLVVDVDMRRSSRQVLEDGEPEEDLRAALIGQCDWRDVIHRVPVTGGDVYAITCGGDAPVELLSSDRMADFLAEAREEWDYVLLDAPSFPLVSDALVLTPNVDCVLTLIRLDATPQRVALEHVQRLSAASPGYALIINDPGVSQRRSSAYPAVPQRVWSQELGRWTWRDLESMEPGERRRGWDKRLLIPVCSALVVGSLGTFAWTGWHKGRARPTGAAGAELASSAEAAQLYQLSPAGKSAPAVPSQLPQTSALVPQGGQPELTLPAGAVPPEPGVSAEVAPRPVTKGGHPEPAPLPSTPSQGASRRLDTPPVITAPGGAG